MAQELKKFRITVPLDTMASIIVRAEDKVTELED